MTDPANGHPCTLCHVIGHSTLETAFPVAPAQSQYLNPSLHTSHNSSRSNITFRKLVATTQACLEAQLTTPIYHSLCRAWPMVGTQSIVEIIFQLEIKRSPITICSDLIQNPYPLSPFPTRSSVMRYIRSPLWLMSDISYFIFSMCVAVRSP